MTERPDVAVAGSLSRAAASVVGGGSRGVGRATLLDVYTEQAGILADAGVDLIALEMMSAVEHAEPALAAARSTGLPVWLGLSADQAAGGRLIGWQSPERPFDDLAAREPCRQMLGGGDPHRSPPPLRARLRRARPSRG